HQITLPAVPVWCRWHAPLAREFTGGRPVPLTQPASKVCSTRCRGGVSLSRSLFVPISLKGETEMDATMTRRHLYPRANPAEEPSPWWYFGRAVYVSRYDYKKIFFVFLAIGIPLGAVGVLLKLPVFLYAAFALAAVGIAMLIYSLIGLYRQYGHFSVQYFRRLLELAGARGPLTVADFHIGTYRHSYRLAEVLPDATIYSVDCWNVEGPPAEKAIRDVRDL